MCPNGQPDGVFDLVGQVSDVSDALVCVIGENVVRQLPQNDQ